MPTKPKATPKKNPIHKDTLDLKGDLRLIEQAGNIRVTLNGEPLDVLLAQQFGGNVFGEAGHDVSGRFHIVVRRIGK